VTDTESGLWSVASKLALADPVDGAGVVAAGVSGLAAGLCESIARGSLYTWVDAGGVAIQAATLRERAVVAGRANAAAYAVARDVLGGQSSSTGRDATLRAALIAAADTLLSIASVGGDCAALAAEIAVHCEPAIRPDAAGAAELAASAARVASALVEVNLALLPGDERRRRADAIAVAADRQSRRARDADAS